MSIVLHLRTEHYHLIAAEGRVIYNKKWPDYQPLTITSPDSGPDIKSDVFRKIIPYQNGFVACHGTYGESGNDVFDMIKHLRPENSTIDDPFEFTWAIYNKLITTPFKNVGVSIGFQNRNNLGMLSDVAFIVSSENNAHQILHRNCFIINGCQTVDAQELIDVFRSSYFKVYQEHMVSDVFNKPYEEQTIRLLLHTFFHDVLEIYNPPIGINTKISYGILQECDFTFIQETPTIIKLD
jgi:hypothetical protein